MEAYNITDISHIYVFYINSLLEECEKNRRYIDQSLYSNYDDAGLSLTDFFKRLFGKMCCSLECFFISLIYIKRFHESNRGVICSTSIKNVITASLVLAQKFFDEICYKSEFYGSFANLTANQMNSLEVDFLCRIHFSLMVYPRQYEIFYNQMCNLCRLPCLQREGVSLPQLLDVDRRSECPLLKYVLTPQEQQRKALYYRQHPEAVVAPPPIMYRPKQMVGTLHPKQSSFSVVPKQVSVVLVPPYIQSSAPVQVRQQSYCRQPVQVCVNSSQTYRNYQNPPGYSVSQPIASNHSVYNTFNNPSSSEGIWSARRM